jgi:LmbE family N-acetylglucosaminyl deacetylase
MIGLSLRASTSGPLRVLCLGAHCDDIEIGCGGTLLRLRASHPDLEIRWHVLTSEPERAAETRRAAALFGLAADDHSVVRIDAFRDGFLPWEGAAVKEAILAGRGAWQPDVVFTHARDDRHQDHRVVSDLTWNAYRDHLILEYEIPKWDGDLGQPSLFVALDEATVARKLEILDTVYATQKRKAAFSLEAYRGLMALRGIEARAASGFAEAFYARKLGLFLA